MRRKPLLLVIATLLLAVGAWFFWGGSGASSSSTNDKKKDASSTTGDAISKLHKARQAKGIKESSPASISGVVVDTSGSPLPGALVLAKKREGLSQMSLNSDGPPLTATSDEEGRFTFAVVAPGKQRITASAEGHLPEPLDLYVSSGEQKEGVRVVLRPGGHTLSGTITDVGGGGVSSAVITIMRSAGFDRKSYTVAQSDSEGNYKVQLETGAYTVVASHEDYVRREARVSLTSARTLDMSLSPAGAIYGRVVTRDGKPLGKAKVYASGGLGGERPGDGMSMAGMVDTDESGAFVMRGLSSGSYGLQAAAKGYTSTEATDVELGIAETIMDIEVIVDAAHTISGFVVENDNQEVGIRGVQVMAMNMRGQTFAFAFSPTEKDGYFEIFGVTPGTYMIVAYHEDLLGSFMEHNVTIKDKDVDDVLLKLKRGATVRGRVDPPMVADIGLVVEEVGLTNMMDMALAAGVKTRSDEDGNFELKPAPSGDFLIVARAKDGREGELAIEIGSSLHEGVIVAVDDGLSISGKVVDEKGKPVVAVRVAVTPQDGDKTMQMMQGMGGQKGYPVNEKGEFSIRGLGEGEYRVEVLDSRGKLAWADRKPEDQNRSKTLTLGTSDITGEVLAVVKPSGVIRGVVIGIDGQPMPDAWVGASRVQGGMMEMVKQMRKQEEDGEEVSDGLPEGYDPYRWGEKEDPALTDTEGRFVIRDLRDGYYQLTANAANGGARAKQSEVKPGDKVTLTLEEMTNLRVIVTQAGAPVKRYVASLSGSASRSQQVISESGDFVFSRLARGEYRVSISTEEASATEKVTVGEHKETTLGLELEAWCGVRGVVLDVHSQEPVPGLVVWPQGSEAEMSQRGMEMMTGKGPRTDDKGAFEVGKLQCGRGAIVLMSPDSMFSGGGGVGQKSFEVAEGVKDLGAVYFNTKKKAPAGEAGSFGFFAMAPDDGAAKISHVEEGGAAAQAGVLLGEEVTSVNDMDAKELGDVIWSLLGDTVRIGDTMKLSLVNGEGEAREVTLTAIARTETAP